MLVAIIVVAVLIVLVLGASLVTYFVVFFSPHKGQNDIHNVLTGEQYDDKKSEMLSLVDGFAKVPFEQVFVKSFDGLKLAGQYYHSADGAPLAICFHGYRGSAVRDYCGGATLLLKEGFNVLVVHQRAQGQSKGHTITFGVKERWDCIAWIHYALQRFGSNIDITLYGISMGATTVLLASGLNLPQNVRGIVADCPYNSPKEIICKVCRDMKLSCKLFYPFIWLGAVLFGRFNPSNHSAVEAVKRAQVPILIIHGEDDRLVPCEMSKEIQAANSALVRRETFSGAAHGISYLTDRQRYEKVVLEFLKDVAARADANKAVASSKLLNSTALGVAEQL